MPIIETQWLQTYSKRCAVRLIFVFNTWG